jgi:multicomponent Na+:H+ antiporter subunit D
MSDPGLLAHPAWPFLVAAALGGLLPARARRGVGLLASLLGVALAWTLPDATAPAVDLLGQRLVWLRGDALARPFAVIFALFGGIGLLYGWSASLRLHVAGPAATAAALGVVLAGDWVTLYLAWEALALASFALVADGGSARAARAAYRYLLVHVAGGACLLAGIVWHRAGGGSALVDGDVAGTAAALVLLAFAINAAVPPLHAWLTDAYPESSPAGAALLSAFATKSAVYALARVFPGLEGLVWAGVAMTLYGVLFAILENDIRRLLGYHIVSQVGYMVTGVGLGTPLALNGAVAHAFCHILYKGLLFMGAGAVIHATGRRRLTELGGLGASLPATLVLYMVGALSISGAPLLNGFVSKSLVVAAAEESHRDGVALLLTLAAVGTFLSVGLKLPFFTFGGPARRAPDRPVPRAMLVAMGLAAGLCVLTGVAPGPLYRLLPHAVDYRPYTAGHVLGALQLLTGTGVAFGLLAGRLKGAATRTVDADRVYRAIGRWLADGAGARIARAADRLEAAALAVVERPPRPLPRPGPAPVGYAVLYALVALGLGLALLGALG